MQILGVQIRTYRWHSINLVPHGGAFDVVDDDDFSHVLWRNYWVTVFGQVINVHVPSSRKRYAVGFLNTVGPLWSRRGRYWYRADEV